MAALRTEGIIERLPGRSRSRSWNFAHFAALSQKGRSGASRVLRGQRCQSVQRLWKALHRDDLQPLRIPARNLGVRPGRREKNVHTRLARADRFLLDGADWEHRAVQCELTGGRDLVAV